MSSQMSAMRFADYFVVCGLDTTTGLEPDQLAGDNLQCPPLDRPFKSKVLQHVPDNVPWNPFDNAAVGMLCMPQGLSFCTQRESKRARFHSFLITKEDGSRIFGSALTFFEEVRDRKICAAMQTLQHMYRAQPEEEVEEENQSTLQLRHSPKVTKRSSPRQSIKVFDSQTDMLFVTKCLCLITQYPFVTAPREYLKQLYEAIEKPSKSHLPLESYIYNILTEVPLPPPGRSMKFYGVYRAVFTQRPSVSELPLFDFSLWDLCRYLEVKDLILLFTSVLLEHQILLYSS
ncbi:DENN domain-containing protein 5A-like, partial [Saccostrea cucullata]